MRYCYVSQPAELQSMCPSLPFDRSLPQQIGYFCIYHAKIAVTVGWKKSARAPCLIAESSFTSSNGSNECFQVEAGKCPLNVNTTDTYSVRTAFRKSSLQSCRAVQASHRTPLLSGRKKPLTNLDSAWPVYVLRAWLDHRLFDELGLISRHRSKTRRCLKTATPSCMLYFCV